MDDRLHRPVHPRCERIALGLLAAIIIVPLALLAGLGERTAVSLLLLSAIIWLPLSTGLVFDGLRDLRLGEGDPDIQGFTGLDNELDIGFDD
jgi:hypothetical protein